ncbi:MAG: phenylpropionate dioxygenase-like ring-hydroxylating dioxygenase large terminal subunit [Gammaproteobacteria bacterium]|jgi:phenylpropionate dioxygenase-like ring-hydroxylating dioxygenase large terminal subunit
MSIFLKNSWYVAAWADEIEQSLTSTRVLGEKICLFRNSDNRAIAFEDYCPHRRLPLSMGRLHGDLLECGYHGLTFDGSGNCVAAPTNGKIIPDGARVKTYPLVEKYGLLWIWMGDFDQADTNQIFEVKHFDDDTWGYNRGQAIDVECNYQYINDNLLDPSHVAWVHHSTFGEANTRDTPLKTTLLDQGVAVTRWMLNCDIAPFYQKVVPFKDACDRLQHYEVRYPSLALIKAVFTHAGKGGDNFIADGDTFIMDSYNFMTPVDDRNTRYYWFQLRNVEPDNEAISTIMSEGVKSAFEEDRIILNALQKGMDEKPQGFISLRSDTGGFQFRRRLQQLIDRENQSTL